MFYVTMTDNFMSGWGRAKGKINKFVVICEAAEQAEEVKRNAMKRPEMKRVSVRRSRPHYCSEKVYVTMRTYDECPGFHD